MAKDTEARERILEAANELFYKQGYNDTGVNQIIKKANVAKASLYYHFSTKEELCLAYLEERHKTWNTSFNSYLENKENKVLASFDFLEAFNESYDYRGCAFLNMLSETSSNKSHIFKVLQNQKKNLRQFFERELDEFEKDFAFTIYCLFENAIIESQLFKSQKPVKKIKSIVAEMLIQQHIH